MWVWLFSVWSEWRSGVFVVKAATVIGWHRNGFRVFWTWKVPRGKSGRLLVPQDARELIRTMNRENPIGGGPDDWVSDPVCVSGAGTPPPAFDIGAPLYTAY